MYGVWPLVVKYYWKNIVDTRRDYTWKWYLYKATAFLARYTHTARNYSYSLNECNMDVFSHWS